MFPLTVLYLAFMNQILSMFGQALNPIIRSDGSPKFAMAAINNMIRKYGALDEIFGQEQDAFRWLDLTWEPERKNVFAACLQGF